MKNFIVTGQRHCFASLDVVPYHVNFKSHLVGEGLAPPAKTNDFIYTKTNVEMKNFIVTDRRGRRSLHHQMKCRTNFSDNHRTESLPC